MKTKKTDLFIEEYAQLVDNILSHEDIKYMSSNELHMYAEDILKILFSKVRAKLTEKRDLEIYLDSLTNEQFEQYMIKKYGKRWMLVTILPEELDRCPVISEEEIKKALKLGEEDARKACK